MICKAFGNGSSANIKLSKTQLFKMVTLGRFVPLHFLTLYGLAKSNGEKNKILSKLEKYNSKLTQWKKFINYDLRNSLADDEIKDVIK